MEIADRLKEIATADDADTRLELSGKLADEIGAMPDYSDQIDALKKESADLRSQLDSAVKERDDMKQKYIDRFFSKIDHDDAREEAPKEGATISSFLGEE